MAGFINVLKQPYILKYSKKLNNNLLHMCNYCTESTKTDIKTQESEEEVLERERHLRRVCDISGLPHELKSKLSYVNKLPESFYKKQYRNILLQRDATRKQYAMLGKASGIDPAVMWNTKEEYRELFAKDLYSPSLEECIRADIKRQQEENMAKAERLESVRLRMEVLMPQLMAKRVADAAPTEKQVIQGNKLRDQLDELLLEAREYLGYKVSLNDPEFEALRDQRKEKERLNKKQDMKRKKLMMRRGMLQKTEESAKESGAE